MFNSPCAAAAAAAADVGDVRSSGQTNGATHGIPIKRVKRKVHVAGLDLVQENNITTSADLVVYNIMCVQVGYDTRTAYIGFALLRLGAVPAAAAAATGNSRPTTTATDVHTYTFKNTGAAAVYYYYRYCIMGRCIYNAHHTVVDFGYRIRIIL